MIHGQLISLWPYTKERCHEFYKQYVSDPLMTEKPFYYDPHRVDLYYESKIADSQRCFFAVVHKGHTIGEIQLKYIDDVKRTGVLSIILADDSVKNKGYGTEAEKLIVEYGFDKLGLEIIYADAVKRNSRSKHVLEKIGFIHTHDDEFMSYYMCKKQKNS